MKVAGRKRHSPIWDYFEYDSMIDKSKCIVMSTDGNICGMQLKGKNPTNLKVHFRSGGRRLAHSQTATPHQELHKPSKPYLSALHRTAHGVLPHRSTINVSRQWFKCLSTPDFQQDCATTVHSNNSAGCWSTDLDLRGLPELTA